MKDPCPQQCFLYHFEEKEEEEKEKKKSICWPTLPQGAWVKLFGPMDHHAIFHIFKLSLVNPIRAPTVKASKMVCKPIDWVIVVWSEI